MDTCSADGLTLFIKRVLVDVGRVVISLRLDREKAAVTAFFLQVFNWALCKPEKFTQLF